MPINLDIGQILSVAFGVVFPCWPLILLSGLFQWWGKLIGIVNLSLFVWVLLARVYVAINSSPMLQILIPEPLSTLLFGLTGAALQLIRLGLNFWRGQTVRPSTHQATRPARVPARMAAVPPSPHPNIAILEQRMNDALRRLCGGYTHQRNHY